MLGLQIGVTLLKAAGVNHVLCDVAELAVAALLTWRSNEGFVFGDLRARPQDAHRCPDPPVGLQRHLQIGDGGLGLLSDRGRPLVNDDGHGPVGDQSRNRGVDHAPQAALLGRRIATNTAQASAGTPWFQALRGFSTEQREFPSRFQFR